MTNLNQIFENLKTIESEIQKVSKLEDLGKDIESFTSCEQNLGLPTLEKPR